MQGKEERGKAPKMKDIGVLHHIQSVGIKLWVLPLNNLEYAPKKVDSGIIIIDMVAMMSFFNVCRFSGRLQMYKEAYHRYV